MVSIGEIHIFLQQSRRGLFGRNKTISGLKYLSCRKYSFGKLSEFSKVKNVQDDPESNIHGFLWRDICVSSHQLNMPTWNKQRKPPP
jgi:hypothetical protein